MKKSKSAKSVSGKVSAAKTEHDFLTVGIGASAGGIKALKEFFAAMPADNGMAFVVILHLSQTHESSLAHILQNETAMRVEQVTETVKVEPNNVYVIPPAKGLAMVDGHIELTEPTRIKGKRVPIDLFFRTLADAYGKNGIAVVLSGTGSDGTLGLKRVKETGGIGIAQSPDEAEYDGMPRSAIDTGLVDLILPVGEMPEKIIGLRDAGERIRLPKEKDQIPRPKPGKEPDALNEILAIVRVRTGHDFSVYKHATVLRRIARRLQVHEFGEMPEYLAFLRENQDEAFALQRDLLITVTNFFRDKEAFAVLEREVVPKLFAGKTAADTVRVWSVACATGEEAYSLAIILDEYAARITNAPKTQVFASDINEDAIAAGRECFYEAPIVADVSPERLRRFFTKENGGWRVRKELRETVLFAPHNILRDPPFSKLDLIVCRNLLIYFNRETQEKVLAIFNFALRRDGYLFLGGSESAESSSALFSVQDKKHRLYRARPATQFQPLPMLPAPGGWNPKIPQLPIEKSEESPSPPSSYGEIHYQLVEQFAPPSVLVSEDYEILHVSEHADRFLRVTVGEPTRNLLKVVNPALKLDLQSALLEAKKNGAVGESRNVRFPVRTPSSGSDLLNEKTSKSKRGVEPPAAANPEKISESTGDVQPPATAGGSDTLVNITVRLLQKPNAAETFYLVVFDESKSAAAPDEAGQRPQTIAGRDAVDGIVRQLEKELRTSRERLRATAEQNETSSEELKASNEELQAINEELRSTSEELETGKEELQSLNEELTTVNHELRDKVDETLRLNSDLQNLISSTDIGTIFLDRALKIKRYTPRVAEIFNIIPTDIGRPLEHITHRLESDHLADDAGEVLKTLHLKEREMRGGANDSRYLVRIAPYRTLEDKIDGVVLSFQDITDLKRAADALGESEERFSAIVNQTTAGMVETDLSGKIILVNQRFCDITGYSRDELFKMRLHDLVLREDLPESEKLFTRTAEMGEPFAIEKRYVRKDGSSVWVHTTVTAITGADGAPKFVLVVALDITDLKRVEADLRASEETARASEDRARVSEEKYRSIFNSIDEAFCIVEMISDGRKQPFDFRYLETNPAFAAHTGVENAAGKTMRELFPDLEERWFEFYGNAALTGEAARVETETMNRWFDFFVSRVGNGDRRQLAIVFTDITAKRKAEEALREKEAELEAIVSETPFMLARCTGDLRYRYVSRAYAEMFRRSPEEINGKPIIETVGEKSWNTVAPHVERVLRGERVEFETEVDFRGAGEPFFLQVAYTPDTDEQGKVVGWFASIVDITERRRAEEIIRKSEEEMRLVFESTEDFFIATFDLEGRVTRWNSGAENIFGYSEAEIIGQSGEVLFTPEDRAARLPEHEMQTALREGRAVDERWHVRRDGTRFYASGIMHPLKDVATKGFVKIARDLTEKIAAENTAREKETLRKMVGAQEDERRRIAQDLHDHLGQQLTALRLKIESMKIMCADNETLCERVEETQAIAQQIDADIDFLSWEMRPSALDDIGLAAALANYVGEWSRHFNIPADFQANRFGKNRLAPDAETHLYRIAQEALNNVFKHAQATNVDVSLERRDGFAVLIVEDDGIGFAPAKVSGKKDAKRIGLSGMKERAALVGGKVEIESAPGKGTTIFVRVPVADSEKSNKRKKKKDE